MSFSLQSHSAARGSILGVAADTLHLAAMVVWLGSIVILILSGLPGALTRIRTREAIAVTSYGRALGVKTVLFGLLVWG